MVLTSKKKSKRIEEEEELEAKRKAKEEKERLILRRMKEGEADDLYFDGVRLQGKHSYDQALRCYTKALQSIPEHIPSLFNSGLLLERMNQHERAREMYGRAMEACKGAPAFRSIGSKLAAFCNQETVS